MMTVKNVDYLIELYIHILYYANFNVFILNFTGFYLFYTALLSF